MRVERMTITKKKICELLVMIVICSGNEIPDNQGKEFIIGFMEADQARNGEFSESPLKLFITTASEIPVNVQVSAPMAKTLYQGEEFTFKKGTIQQISIPRSLRSQETERAKKAIHIVSSGEIVVFGINQAHLSTDGFLGIPVDVLGTKYFLPSFISTAENFFQSALLIVGIQDRTMLNIKLPSKNDIDIRLEGKSYNRGDWINTTVNKFDSLQLRCHADLTGTLVLSSHKVSVFGGSTVTSIGVGKSRDHIEEQIPPVNVWGKKFAVNPFPDTNPNILRFLASEDNTIVNIDSKETVHMMAGDFHETHMDTFSFISSNKPILSVQYVPSGTCRRDDIKPGCHKGDPAMTLIPPVEQSNIFYSFLTPVSSQNSNFSNIFMFVIEDSHENGILLDNKILKRSDFQSVVRSHNLAAGYIQIPPGSHTIEHSSENIPFGGILYGGIQYESYAFPVGQRFATINEKECRPVTMVVGDGVDNDCDGQVDEEICNDLKDNDKDGRRDEDCSKEVGTTTKTTSSTATTTPVPTTTTTKTTTVTTPLSSTTTTKITPSTATTTPVPTTTKTTPLTATSTPVPTTTTTKTTPSSTMTTPVPTTTTLTTLASKSTETTTKISQTKGKTTPVPIVTESKTTTATPATKATTTTATKRTTTMSTTPITTMTTTLTPPFTTLSPVGQNTHMSEDLQRPTWLSYIEYGIIGGVSLVIIGALGVCCKKCFGLLAKRDDDDDEEEEYRQKMYKKTRQAFGAPAIRPMYM